MGMTMTTKYDEINHTDGTHNATSELTLDMGSNPLELT